MDIPNLNRSQLRALIACLLAYDNAITYHTSNDVPLILFTGVDEALVYLILSNDIEITAKEKTYNIVTYKYFDTDSKGVAEFDNYECALAGTIIGATWTVYGGNKNREKTEAKRLLLEKELKEINKYNRNHGKR